MNSVREQRAEKLEIGRVLHFKSEIQNLRLDVHYVELKIPDFGYFGCEMQDSSNFRFLI
jgi:hypothetical protein